MSKTGYRGVYPHGRSQKFMAAIVTNGCLKYLGSFSTTFEAARAFDFAAWKLRGKKAKLNFPPLKIKRPRLPYRPHDAHTIAYACSMRGRKTASQLADELGLSRNMVCGIWNRYAEKAL